jgi:4-oxalomesaconate tautomerase
MTQEQVSIPCSVIRGGTSRGVYFSASDLPGDDSARNRVLLAVLGGPDALQVDGIGGGHPLTNKIAILSRSSHKDADVDYLFLQVFPDEKKISATQNCGNILAGVGPFAVDHGMVSASDPETKIRVHMTNSGNLCELILQTPGGAVTYRGDTAIDGVPGTSAAIVCNFLDVAGSATGALLPTGNPMDEISGVQVTCIDNGMPIVMLRAKDLGCTGLEMPDELDANKKLKARLEAIRLELGYKMNLGDVTRETVPKMCLVSRPSDGGTISTRTFIPHVCHHSIGVLGAVSVGTACLLPDTVANEFASAPVGDEKKLDIEHPSGSLRIRLVVEDGAPPERFVKQAGVIRTARTLMHGEVFVPSVVWAD